ncbi:MAG: yrrT [Paenibacillus sp.]|nr:yrrT [Paenibacillus sp.]
MNVQQISKRLNMTPRAIRFYEEKGLLKPQRNKENQYRMYGEADAWRLQTIGALRELDIPLDEISGLLMELDKGEQDELTACLSVQRSLLFERWTGMKQLLTGLDRLIEKAACEEGLGLDDLYELAEQEKRMKTTRSKWVDRWNYNAVAAHFDLGTEGQAGESGYPTAIAQYEEVLSETAAAVCAKRGEKGLDIGTGTGNLAGKLLVMGVHMAGVDQSNEMLRRSKEKYPALETKLGNWMSIPYFDASFDFVVSSFAMQHLTDEQKLLALQEASRVLKPAGRICLADYMFTDEEHRACSIKHWRRNGEQERLHAAENKYYANCSTLLEWFRMNNFTAYTQSLSAENELLHLIVAKRRL